MTEQFNTVAVVGRSQDLRVAEPMVSLVKHLGERGIEVITTPDTPVELPARRVDDEQIGKAADLIVTVGGDGTMLYAASLALRDDVPLLGVNRGRLGFLADITPAEMLERIDQVLAGNYTHESRLLIEAVRRRNGETDLCSTGFNDVVVERRGAGRMLDIHTAIAGRTVNTHSGDGLIIATPTGSTAYALSCGGPIIEPGMDAVVVVPICPHTLSDRPIVVPAGKDIEIRLLERVDTRAELMIDGRPLGELTPDDRLIVRRAEARVRLIHPPGYDFYELLRSKLHWGRDNRLRDIQSDET